MSPRYMKKTKKPSKAMTLSKNDYMQYIKLQNKDNKKHAAETADAYWSTKSNLFDSPARTSTQNHEKCDSSVKNASKSLEKLDIYEKCSDVCDQNILEKMLEFVQHNQQCPRTSIKWTENRYGLETNVNFNCQTCKKTCLLKPPLVGNGKMSLNEAIVKGALAIGISCAELNQFLLSIGLNAISAEIFQKYSGIKTRSKESEPKNKELALNLRKLSINEAVVLGAISIGMDCSRMNKLMSSIEIPPFEQDLFDSYFIKYCKIYKEHNKE